MAAATNLKEITEHIKKMKFRKKLFGGVDEADVWKQIRELDADYRNLFKIQNQIFKMELARAKGQQVKSTTKNNIPAKKAAQQEKNSKSPTKNQPKQPNSKVKTPNNIAPTANDT